jgi:DHA3 family macrolide efflux protein-like MFS transporter
MNNNWKRTFAIIWSGQFFSILTSSLVNFAIIIWLSLQTGSAEILAYAAIAGMLPQILIGPFTGALIDRWNRKRIMMLADTFIALCTFILAFLFWFDIAELWHIFALLALRSIGSSFHSPAMQASVPLLAPTEQLTR